MKRTHWVTVVGEFNWKCVQDNFNESYHLPYVHPQTLASMKTSTTVAASSTSTESGATPPVC